MRALPHHKQITQHFCIQGWSGVAKWGGVSMQTILDLVRPKPEAQWVVFYSFADGPEGGIYYDVHAIEQMRYKLTMLTYDMNGKPLPPDHGAPLRLRNETQLGFKQVKWIKGLEFVPARSPRNPRPRASYLPPTTWAKRTKGVFEHAISSAAIPSNTAVSLVYTPGPLAKFVDGTHATTEILAL